MRDPAPVYPHSLIWHGDNPHPALTALREYLTALREYLAAQAPPGSQTGTWTPAWAVTARR